MTGTVNACVRRTSWIGSQLRLDFGPATTFVKNVDTMRTGTTISDASSVLTSPFYVTGDYDLLPAFLAAAVMQQFYTPMSPRPSYQPLLIQHMDVVVAAVVPIMFHTLEFSFTDPQRQGYHPEDVVVLSTLAALLQHETGIAEFADIGPAMLTLKIKTIIWMWLKVSGSTFTNVLDIDLVKIIQALTDYAPTRGALEEAVASIPRSLFRTGLNHLNASGFGNEDMHNNNNIAACTSTMTGATNRTTGQ
ncbi:hypothetical protein CPB85DRAFT_1255045 [Mucidula mucida]|nr:hypothetical protein CPB85DRAFT_1255045 [Mucidula mucida]